MAVDASGILGKQQGSCVEVYGSRVGVWGGVLGGGGEAGEHVGRGAGVSCSVGGYVVWKGAGA